VPTRRRFPPPLTLSQGRYWEAREEMDQEDEREEGEDTDSEDEGHPRCFEPHILEMTRDRLVYPPVEINRPGPPTNRSLPVWSRRYHPYADTDVHYNIMRVEKLVVVDLRNLTVADPRLPIPTGQMGVFSVLAPRNDPHGLIFPGLIWPDQFGPIDFPLISATTLGQRYEELRTIRQRVAMFIERVRRIFPDWVRKELESQEISLFSLKGRQLISESVDVFSYPPPNLSSSHHERRSDISSRSMLRPTAVSFHPRRGDSRSTSQDTSARQTSLLETLRERLF
jgi:hypothetical protein